MLTIEIAGHSLKYRNAPDLNNKARVLLVDLQNKRAALDKESEEIKHQERSLQRFLGGKRTSDPLTVPELESKGA